jgi:O-antigen/teichoic acid export membrane protein
MMVFGPTTYTHSRREYLGSLLCIQGIIGIVVSLVLVISALVIGTCGYSPTFASTFLGLSASIPFVFMLWITRYAFYMEQAPGRAATGSLLYCALVLSATWAVNNRGALSPCTAFLTIGTAAALTAAFNVWRLQPIFVRTGSTRASQVWRTHWGYGRWSLSSVALRWVPTNITYPLTGAFLGIADVGGLKAVQNLLMPFMNGASSLSVLFQPYASGVFGKSGRSGVRAPVLFVSLFFLLGGILYGFALHILRHQVFGLLYRGRFLEYGFLVPWACASVVLTACSYGAIVGLRAIQRPSSVFVGSCASSIASVVLGTLGVRLFGLRGVVGSSVLSAFLMFAVCAFLFHRETKEESSPVALAIPTPSVDG